MDDRTAPSAQTTARMSRQRRRDTGPELAIRRALHRRGWRYRVDIPPLAGMRRRADIVFTRRRIAVFVDGCFWHRCPLHGTIPKSNTAWWVAKLDRNADRDRDTDARLVDAGWSSVRVWEHQDPEDVVRRLEHLLRSEEKRS